MANLTKIKNVRIVVSTSPAPGAADCTAALAYLTTNSIPHRVVNSPALDPVYLVLNSLSKNGFGPNGTTRAVDTFPVILWEEQFNDKTNYTQIAIGSVELANSVLLANKSLIS